MSEVVCGIERFVTDLTVAAVGDAVAAGAVVTHFHTANG